MKMKKSLLSVVLMAVPLFSHAKGEIRSGQLWPDNHGVHVNAHGGGILSHRGIYYWFGEHKAENTSNAMVGVTCYSSKNLTDWKKRGSGTGRERRTGQRH